MEGHIATHNEAIELNRASWKFEEDYPFNNYLEDVLGHLDRMKFNPTPEQLDFLLHTPNTTLADSTAGSGKTTTVVIKSILDEKIWGIEPYEIIFLTFSRQSAFDMKYRRDQLLNKYYDDKNDARMSTLHSMCFSFMRMFHEKPAGIYFFDKNSIIQEELYSLAGAGIDDFADASVGNRGGGMVTADGINIGALGGNRQQQQASSVTPKSSIDIIEEALSGEEDLKLIEDPIKAQDFMSCMSFQKERMMSDEDILEERIFQTMSIPAENYFRMRDAVEKRKKTYEYFDFTDIQKVTLDTIRNNRDFFRSNSSFRALFKASVLYVDEVQDMTPLQKELIKELVEIEVEPDEDDNVPDTSLVCIGDGDQTIYGWRGSDTLEFSKFQDTFDPSRENSDLKIFSKNHRCGSAILDEAKKLIEHNTLRNPKNMHAGNHVGKFGIDTYTNSKDMVKSVVREVEEEYLKDGIEAIENTAILYREHAQAMGIATALLRKQIPIYMASSSKIPYKHWIFKNLIKMCEAILFDTSLHHMDKLHQFTPLNTKQVVALKEEIKTEQETSLNRVSWIDKLDDMSRSGKYRSISEDDITEYRALKRALDTPGSPMQMILNRLYALYQRHNLNYVLENLIHVERAEIEAIEYFLATIPRNEDYVTLMKNIEEWDVLIRSYQLSKQGVRLMTLHSTKGLEFDKVIIIGLDNEYLPKESYANELDGRNKLEYIEEERRLLYVGITRAINTCHIYANMVTPSMFLMELDEEVRELHQDNEYQDNIEIPIIPAIERFKDSTYKDELKMFLGLI